MGTISKFLVMVLLCSASAAQARLSLQHVFFGRTSVVEKVAEGKELETALKEMREQDMKTAGLQSQSRYGRMLGYTVNLGEENSVKREFLALSSLPVRSTPHELIAIQIVVISSAGEHLHESIQNAGAFEFSSEGHQLDIRISQYLRDEIQAFVPMSERAGLSVQMNLLSRDGHHESVALSVQESRDLLRLPLSHPRQGFRGFISSICGLVLSGK